MSDYPHYSDSSSTPAQSMEVTEKQKILSEQLRSDLAHIENAWEQMSKKHSLYNGVSSEVGRAFCTFTQYSNTVKYYEAFTRRTEFHSNAEKMRKTLDKLKENLNYAGGVIDAFIQMRQKHMDTIQTILHAVSCAQSVVELSSISVPSLDWLLTVPDPNVDQIAAEWCGLGLQAKLDHHLVQLQNLIKLKTAQYECDTRVSPGKRKRSE